MWRTASGLTRLVVTLGFATVAIAQGVGGRVRYVGGTLDEIPTGTGGILLTGNDRFLVFDSRKVNYAIPWDRINLLEYGQRVSRRYALAVMISPLLLAAKKRVHYLTIGFLDRKDRQQALVFEVDKHDIRALLVVLETRTNLRVEYQDDEARKSGKG